MKYPPIAEKTYPHSGTFALGDLSSQLSEKRKNIRPLNVPGDGMCEDRFQSFFIFSFHIFLVPQFGTIVKVEYVAGRVPVSYTGPKPRPVISRLVTTKRRKNVCRDKRSGRCF